MLGKTIKTERRLVRVGSPSLSYDNRGNLLSDGGYVYTWDLADRLASVEVDPTTSDLTDADRIKLEYTYDHNHRRTSKTVYQWDSGTSAYVTGLRAQTHGSRTSMNPENLYF